MIKVTYFNRFLEHKVFIIVVLIILALLITFSLLIIRLKNYLQTQTATNQATPSSDIYYATTSGNPNWYLDTASPAANPILSTSGDSGISDIENDETYSSPTPYPIPTYTPAPTTAPVYISSSPPSCAGTPTAYNSEAIVSTSSTLLNNAATISIELLDCNNNYTSVNDSLMIALSNSDSTAKINGSSSPVSIQAQNGKASFTVNSQNAGTDTFVITDTTRPFTVTDPHNHNPSVTFANNTSGNSSCTSGAGTPNSWYSDVYPNPPISTNNGSIKLIVDIRDCNFNLAPVTDTINITLSSGDPNTQVNGNTLPQNVTTQNGEADFTVTSQVTGTVILAIQDTTSSFPVTDKYSHPPSISFSVSSTPTPVPTSLSLSCGASPSSVPADGSSASQITLQLKDGTGNTINNQSSINVSSSDSSNSISGNPFTTNGDGNISFSITSTNQGQPTFTVSENGASATTNCVTFTESNPQQNTQPPSSSSGPSSL